MAAHMNKLDEIKFLDELEQRRYLPRKLSSEEVEEICVYLKNPTSKGIWKLKADWNLTGGISEFIINKLKQKFNSSDSIEVSTKKITVRKAEQDHLIRLTSKITFVLSLFNRLCVLDENEGHFVDFYTASEYESIFNLLDLTELKSLYSEALQYFRENIYFKGFSPIVRDEKILELNRGLIFIETLSEHNKIMDGKAYKELSLISLTMDSIVKLDKFFAILGKISNVKIYPIFSPEDEVFIPYFSFLEHTYNEFIENENIRRLLKNTISDYDEKDYSHCVSTIGLIAEDYLIQIYETFFRDVCPKEQSLGRLFTIIQNAVNSKFGKHEKEKLHPNLIYRSIDELQQNPAVISDILKSMLSYSIQSYQNVKNTIETLNRSKVEISLFPYRIQENLREIILYRNATSHKSTIPIGKREALRCIYCCTTLILWFINEKKIINWNDSKEKILQDIVLRNKN